MMVRQEIFGGDGKLRVVMERGEVGGAIRARLEKNAGKMPALPVANGRFVIVLTLGGVNAARAGAC
jgi:hypothetical protein